MADIFDEIGEDLRAERLQTLLRRFGPLLAVVLVLVLVAVGGWQVWRGRQAQQAAQVAESYLAASKQSGSAAIGAFQDLAETGPEGYRTLARLREAALKADAGDLPGALALWDAVSADGSADRLLRDLASLLWAQHQVDGGDPAQVESRLSGLASLGNPWSPLAREQQALLLIRTKQEDKARDVLRALRDDRQAPEGVRGRAAGLLVQLGEMPPAPGTGEGG